MGFLEILISFYGTDPAKTVFRRFNPSVKNSYIIQRYRHADASATRVRFACLEKISIRLRQDSIFSTALSAIAPSCLQGTMFKFLFRIRLGSRWLLAGIRTSGSPFHVGVHFVGFKEYTVRIFWFECCLSELPF